MSAAGSRDQDLSLSGRRVTVLCYSRQPEMKLHFRAADENTTRHHTVPRGQNMLRLHWKTVLATTLCAARARWPWRKLPLTDLLELALHRTTPKNLHHRIGGSTLVDAIAGIKRTGSPNQAHFRPRLRLPALGGGSQWIRRISTRRPRRLSCTHWSPRLHGCGDEQRLPALIRAR